ncbi:hypothetical protein [Sulfitobacter sp. R18_1]|uniref:hypothetical protein n=1 Tax=Sulfitobacter sp. R18_1 TaxID=2821104 RepID=UPI001ADBE4CB|nr:hypothetical protein [Sulfitobacter sp. R18_1]MBO9428776.1 hypothetical protein [Sulfitobacter sp. R18_1]
MTDDQVNGPIELTPEAFTVPRGKIEATYKKEVEYPDNPGQAFYLHEGEVMEVPNGTAYYIKGDTKWYHAQFFEDGKMTGPVVYAEAKIGCIKDVYMKDLGGNATLVVGVPFAVCGGILSYALSLNVSHAIGFGGVLSILFISLMLLTLWVLVSGVWISFVTLRCKSNSKYAIKAIKKAESKSSPYITPGGVKAAH